jgi:hypothetical protein
MTHPATNSAHGYQYEILKAISTGASSSDQVNVYGVVTEWSAPKATKGQDLLCTVKITDHSLVGADGVVSTQDILMFAPDRAQLPQIKKPGDIIRLHRSRLNVFHERAQLICSLGGLGRKGPPSSMCLFDSTPTPGSLFEDRPYQTSSKTFHFDAKEKAILKMLRDFVQNGGWSSAGQDAEKYRKLVRDIITESSVENVVFADLIGLVLAVEEDKEDGDPKVVWMWDGTDTPPFPSTFSTNTNQGHLPAHEGAEDDENADARAANALRPRPFPLSSLPHSAAAALPMIGTAVPIIIKGSVLELPKPGSWAKFRNCGFQIAKGQLQGVFAQKSRWNPWHEDIKVIEEYTKRLAMNTISEWYKPGARCFSITPHPDQDLTSLRQIAADAVQPNAQPMSYRCRVRVVAHSPAAANAETMCAPARASWEAAKADGYTAQSQYLYALQLHIVDGSGTEIAVDLFGQGGEEFFKEIQSPKDLRTDETAKNKILAALNYLTGNQEGPNPSSEPIWVDMCLKSYFLSTSAGEETNATSPNNSTGGGASGRGGDDERSKRVVRYRVFDTKLLPLPTN